MRVSSPAWNARCQASQICHLSISSLKVTVIDPRECECPGPVISRFIPLTRSDEAARCRRAGLARSVVVVRYCENLLVGDAATYHACSRPRVFKALLEERFWHHSHTVERVVRIFRRQRELLATSSCKVMPAPVTRAASALNPVGQGVRRIGTCLRHDQPPNLRELAVISGSFVG